jgi:hypothetical protein
MTTFDRNEYATQQELTEHLHQLGAIEQPLENGRSRTTTTENTAFLTAQPTFADWNSSLLATTESDGGEVFRRCKASSSFSRCPAITDGKNCVIFHAGKEFRLRRFSKKWRN